MKWIMFTGTWRLTNQEVKDDVRAAAREVFSSGNGMVTGGGTGVDFFVMDEWIKLDPECRRVRIYIPSSLSHYIADYRKNWKHAPITDTEIDAIEKVLTYIKTKNPAAFFELPHAGGDITQDDYDKRHNEEITYSHEVYAFQVNNSHGTQDTIDKSQAAGLPITLYKKYTIQE